MPVPQILIKLKYIGLLVRTYGVLTSFFGQIMQSRFSDNLSRPVAVRELSVTLFGNPTVTVLPTLQKRLW